MVGKNKNHALHACIPILTWQIMPNRLFSMSKHVGRQNYVLPLVRDCMNTHCANRSIWDGCVNCFEIMWLIICNDVTWPLGGDVYQRHIIIPRFECMTLKWNVDTQKITRENLKEWLKIQEKYTRLEMNRGWTKTVCKVPMCEREESKRV